MRASFCSGLASAKIINSRLLGDRRGRERVVARDHDCADTHRAKALKAIRKAAFDDVLELDSAEDLFVSGDHEWCGAISEIPLTSLSTASGSFPLT